MSVDKSMVLCHWLRPTCNYTESSRLQPEYGLISLKVFIAQALNFVLKYGYILPILVTCQSN